MGMVPRDVIHRGAARRTARREPGRRPYVLAAALLLALLAISLGACRLQGASAGPTITSTPSATQTSHDAPPVGVQVIVAQQGTVAERTVQLRIAVQVANHTVAPIHVWYNCGFQPIQGQIIQVATHKRVWASDTYSCPPLPARTLPPDIAPGGVHTFDVVADPGGMSLPASAYQVDVQFNWTQGSDSQAPDGSHPGGQARGGIVVSLQ